MAKHAIEEIDLFKALCRSAALRAKGLEFQLGPMFGVVVSKAGVELGIWGFSGDRYVLRSLASYDPVASAATVSDVVSLTIKHMSVIP